MASHNPEALSDDSCKVSRRVDPSSLKASDQIPSNFVVYSLLAQGVVDAKGGGADFSGVVKN